VASQDILLESGTNEVEIAEIMLCSNNFGVNVAKIREFNPYKGIQISKLPGRPPSVAGVFMLRGRSIPLIELDVHLGITTPHTAQEQVIVVTEFNNMTTAFVADYINQIHRVSWTEFKPLNNFLAANSPFIVGSINLQGKEVLILDLEQIIGEIFPESIVNYNRHNFNKETIIPERGAAHLVFAEDSTLIRSQVSQILRQVGYSDIKVVENGMLAYEHILKCRQKAEEENRPITDFVSGILSDIEMPQMDGLTLCRKVKQDLNIKIPIVMFSSLINDQMAIKCQRMGADGYCNKPETEKLISLLDDLLVYKTKKVIN
jgi:two-component system chemotaxis response regulator CheV